MRAIIYARYSTDRQTAASITDQQRVCKEYAAKHGWKIAGTYKDEAISGAALGNRPAALQMIEAAKRGEFDVCMFMDLSRLSRSQADLPKLIDRLIHIGIRLVGVQDGYDSNEKGHKLKIGFSGIFSESFRETVAEKTYAALETRAKARRPTGGRAYGFDSAREPVEPQASIARELFVRFAAGETMKAIASDLNARDIPSPGSDWKRETRRKDGKWLVSTLHALLHNELYAGRLIWNKHKWRRDPDSGSRTCTVRPRSEWIIHSLPALVDAKTWLACQQRFTAQVSAAGNHRAGRRSYILSGLLVCALCRSKMVVSGGDARRYVCSSRHHGGAHACANNLDVRVALAESILIAPVVDELLQPANIDYMVAQMRKKYRATKVRAVPTARITELDGKIRRLDSLVSDGTLPMAAAADALAKLKHERAAAAKASPSGVAHTTEQFAAALRHQCAMLRKSIAGKDVSVGRAALRTALGGADILLTPRKGELWASTEAADPQNAINLGVYGSVAGAGFGSIYGGRAGLPLRKIAK